MTVDAADKLRLIEVLCSFPRFGSVCARLGEGLSSHSYTFLMSALKLE